MPIIKSAQKRVSVAANKAKVNRLHKSKLRTAIKNFERISLDGDKEKCTTELIKTQKIIDKSAAKGIIHKNNAARKKARLTKIYNQIS